MCSRAVQQPVGVGGIAARLELPEPDEPRRPSLREDARGRAEARAGPARRCELRSGAPRRPARRRRAARSPTLSARRAYREHRAAGRRGVPPHAPLDFASAALQPLIRHDGVTDRRRWESALLHQSYATRSSTASRRPTTRNARSIWLMSRLRNSWGWRLGAVLNSPGKHPFALDRRLDAGSGGPAARREVEVGLFRRVADRASEHRWVTDAGRAPRGVAGGALVMSPGVRAGRR